MHILEILCNFYENLNTQKPLDDLKKIPSSPDHMSFITPKKNSHIKNIYLKLIFY